MKKIFSSKEVFIDPTPGIKSYDFESDTVTYFGKEGTFWKYDHSTGKAVKKSLQEMPISWSVFYNPDNHQPRESIGEFRQRTIKQTEKQMWIKKIIYKLGIPWVKTFLSEIQFETFIVFYFVKDQDIQATADYLNVNYHTVYERLYGNSRNQGGLIRKIFKAVFGTELPKNRSSYIRKLYRFALMLEREMEKSRGVF